MTDSRATYWLLQIEAPHMCAAAVWRNDAQGWRCVDAAPIISWMLERSVAETKAYLEGKKSSAGWSWTWIRQDG